MARRRAGLLRSWRAAPPLAFLLLGVAPSGASAAPPPNDAPAGAAPFETYAAANGRPRDLQAVAELAEAAPDPGVPRCLGRSSFARSVWYRVPAAELPQELAVDAIGRTLDVLDLAAYVQLEGIDAPLTSTPNACSGGGSGGSAAAEEATSGIALRVPARRAVLLQVARRGAAASADDERALLSLDTRPLSAPAVPPGDAAGAATPLGSARRSTSVPLAGATVTEEDPAQPACPALGTVWRRLVPGSSGTRLVRVRGRAASTLTVFAGRRPTGGNALDCVVRSGHGALEMRVRVRRKRTLWLRIGTDRSAANAAASVRVSDGADAPVIDGGPGGFDPTTGGPGGGLSAACDRARATRARIRGPRITGAAGPANRRRFLPVVLSVRGGSVCDARVQLVGRRGDVYAETHARRLRGRRTVRLRRTRPLVAGRYRLKVVAASELGGRVRVRTKVSGRLG